MRRAAATMPSVIGAREPDTEFGPGAASWAGICPGNNQSAGRRRSGRTTRDNRWLKRTLTQCGWAAARCKDSHLSTRYRRLAARRGKKRAVLAVAHSQLAAAYEMLKRGEDYHDLGPDHRDRRTGQRLTSPGFRLRDFSPCCPPGG